MNDKEEFAGRGPLPRKGVGEIRKQTIDEAKRNEIAALALGKRYGIQTMARRTGVTAEAVSVTLRNKGIYWHPALKEWRSRTPNTKKGVL